MNHVLQKLGLLKWNKPWSDAASVPSSEFLPGNTRRDSFGAAGSVGGVCVVGDRCDARSVQANG